MTWHRSEEEVDRLIDDMMTRSKGKYITQGVAFNKTCPRQMGLLKQALMSSASFSGLGKELLAIRFSDEKGDFSKNEPKIIDMDVPKIKNVGNFF